MKAPVFGLSALILACAAASAAVAAPSALESGSPLTREEVFCDANDRIYDYNRYLHKTYGMDYTDSLQPGEELVAQKPMAATTALPGQGGATAATIPPGTRIVIAERFPGEESFYYMVSLPGNGGGTLYVGSGEFRQFSSLEKMIQHRDKIEALRDSFFETLDRDLLKSQSMTYQQLYNMFRTRSIICKERR